MQPLPHAGWRADLLGGSRLTKGVEQGEGVSAAVLDLDQAGNASYRLTLLKPSAGIDGAPRYRVHLGAKGAKEETV